MHTTKIDITSEMKDVILRTQDLKNTFIKTHPNTKYKLETIINEILYFLKAGMSWRLLRSPINYKTLHYHYCNFVKYNIFDKLLNQIKTKYLEQYITNENQITCYMDTTNVTNKFGINKIGRNKFYKNKNSTKISNLSDKNGFPLSILFMKGNYHDITVFEKHIRDISLLIPKNKLKIIADKAYSSNKNYTYMDKHNIKHIIPPRKNMKQHSTYKYDKQEYIDRIKIEHIFSRLKGFRRLSYRYEKLFRNFKGFVLLAFSIIGINIINKIDKDTF